MSNILKGNEIKATAALANVCIAFAILSGHSPESSRPIIVIVSTAIGLAALYPLYLLLQKPRRYRVTKVTDGAQTVYMIRYKGFLWWYDATLPNGKTIAFKSMDEAMEYIKGNVVMDIINRKNKKKTLKRKSTIIYDSISQLKKPSEHNDQDSSDKDEKELDTNPDSPQLTNSINPSADFIGNGSTPQGLSPDLSSDGNAEENKMDTPSISSPNNAETSATSNTPSLRKEETSNTNATEEQSTSPHTPAINQTTVAFFQAMATAQQKSDESTVPFEKENSQNGDNPPIITERTIQDEMSTDESGNAPDDTENNNEKITPPNAETNTISPKPTSESPQVPDKQDDLAHSFFDVIDSYYKSANHKNKRKTANKKAEVLDGIIPEVSDTSTQEALNAQGNKDKEHPGEESCQVDEPLPIENKMNDENTPKGTENKEEETKGEEISHDQRAGWARQVGEMRLSHGNNPRLVSGSLNMIHQHRLLEQERMEASPNADSDAADGKTPPSAAHENEIQNTHQGETQNEEIQTKTIKPSKPSAEERYLKKIQKTVQKQTAKQTSLFDLPEFNNNPKEDSPLPAASETQNDISNAIPADTSGGEPSSSSGGRKVSMKTETGPTSQENAPRPAPPNTQEPTDMGFPQGSEDRGNEPSKIDETPLSPQRQPLEENLSAEEDEVDYGYTEGDGTPNVIRVTLPYPNDDMNDDKDILPI